MNKLTIIGNVTHDPELRTANTANGPVSVCSFSVAVNSRRRTQNGQEETTFFRCTAWRQQAETIAKYVRKGNKIFVVGPVTGRSYQGNDGVVRYNLEVQVEDFEFLTPKSDGTGVTGMNSAAPVSAPQAAPAAPTAQNNGFTAVDSDELPF
ncbi:MAG: single-stranded DNA-binding protein [Clostridia bacterium]|nr:single-stranded DNA-binding protein [Clostridia bacterium]